MIIIEGIDGSGKSTLALMLAKELNVPIQESEGPPREGEDINERIARYLSDPRPMIYVRHPVVSQKIYGIFKTNTQRVEPHLEQRLYQMRPVIIYCDPLDRGLGAHDTADNPSGSDTPEFLAELAEKYQILLQEYRLWACHRASVVYRIGDPVTSILAMTTAALAARGHSV